nr:LAGLIDADG homing endonuclease [Porodaedalea mongolica]
MKPKYNFNDISECKNSRLVNRYVFRDTGSIIKFVNQYPMLTRKHLDYVDWIKIIEIKNAGLHKTVEGLALINRLTNQMNSNRVESKVE